MTSEERQLAREVYFCEASRKRNKVVVAGYQVPEELVFDFDERWVEGTAAGGGRVRMALDRLTRFELDRVSREGDDKVHHYNYLLLSDGENRLVYVERAPEYDYDPSPDTPRYLRIEINLGALAFLTGVEAPEPFQIEDVRQAFRWVPPPQAAPVASNPNWPEGADQADILAAYLRWLGWRPRVPRSDGRELLEYESAVERLLNYLAMGLGGFSLLYLGVFFFKIASGRLDLQFLLASLAAFALASGVLWVRFRVQVHYLLDFERKQVLLCRQMFGSESTRPVARFADLGCVSEGAVSRSEGKGKPRSWHHALFLVLKDGQAVRVSDYARQSEQFGKTSRQQEVHELAARLELPARPISREDLQADRRVLKISRQGEVRHVEDQSGLWGCLIPLAILLAALWMHATYGP